MSKSTRRALRVTLAVAGTAVLCAAFVGTAAAAPSADDVTDAPSNDSSTSEADNGVSQGGLLHNNVVDANLPEFKGASFDGGFTAIPASGPGDNDDRDGVCHGLDGEHEYDNAKVQVPCQSDGNNIHEGEFEIAGHGVAYMMDVPGVEHDGQSEASQSGDQAKQLTDGPGALTNGLHAPEDLNNVGGQKVAVSPV